MKHKSNARTDDCFSSAQLWREFRPAVKPTWLGCTTVLPGGFKCYNAPLEVNGDRCFCHTLTFDSTPKSVTPMAREPLGDE